MKQLIQFILVPDASAARRLRRVLATQAPRQGVIVGTWPELVEQANSAYLVAGSTNEWGQALHAALANMPNAFWAKSYSVAPEETAAEVETALSLLVSATPLTAGTNDLIELGNVDALSGRPKKHVQDIAQLLNELNGLLPDNLLAIKQLHAATPTSAIRSVVVCHLEGLPKLTVWQQSLINKLNADVQVEPDSALMSMLQTVFGESGTGEPKTSLQSIQENLFSSSTQKSEIDESVQWIGVRDCLAEAEVAAGMAQQMLAEHPDLTHADIGLLMPDTFEYSLVVNDAFTAAGLPLSGLPVEHWQRDLGGEVIFHFLWCRQKPAPAMALAACLSSPLMPWSKAQGAELAQKVMDGDYRLKPFAHAAAADQALLDLFREGDDNPESLSAAVKTFVSLLTADDGVDAHLNRAKEVANGVRLLLEDKPVLDWVALRRFASPQNRSTGETPLFTQQGITVWREPYEVWRPVRFLIVLGFASGNYPATSSDSSVFVSDDLLDIRKHLNLPVATPADTTKERRLRFRRQLASVCEFVSFMIPRRDSGGVSQSSSETLVFMQQLFSANEDDDAESLVLELDVESDRSRARYLSVIESEQPTTPRTCAVEDIQFDCDLLALGKDSDGQQKPESPSSLETLMVSRLAWLLRRLKAEPLGWVPERPNVMLLGTLTHSVFEDLFKTASPIPDQQTIELEVAPLLDSAIKRHAPFLKAAQWQAERKDLEAGIRKAAQAWRGVLTTLGADVLGTEEWLQGNLNGVPIHGQADIVLGLPDGRLLVVDYKRSSASSRKPRMEKGYDSQANLYRTMLSTGGPKSDTNNELLERLSKGTTTGIVYFMTNDQTSLTDAPLVNSDSIPGWDVLIDDVSHLAMGLIDSRLKEVAAGSLYLNREGDDTFFDKAAGVKPYALENSALIPIFTIPGDAREAK